MNSRGAPRIKDMNAHLENKIVRVPFSGCWLWIGAVGKGGYGFFGYQGACHLAHRLFYQRLNGPIPDGLDLDHLCRVRSCVNPDHLEPVTRSENIRRIPLIKCPKGHDYCPENTKVSKKTGGRSCRACSRFRTNIAAKKRRDRVNQSK